MPYDALGLPVDGPGKQLALRKAAARGPSGTDVYLEVQANQPDNSVGRELAEQALAAVPTVNTDIFTIDIALDRLFLVNTTNQMVSITITDGSGSAVILLPNSFQLPPGSFINEEFGGIKITGGLKWQASASGVNGAVKGFKA